MKRQRNRSAKNLKPQPRSRFLRGEVDSAMDEADLRAFINHRMSVTHAKAKIDTKPPILMPDTYFRAPKLVIDVQRSREIDRENLQLLQNLNLIHRSGGRVDNWNLDWKYKSNCAEQQKMNKLTMRENEKILKHLNAVRSAFNTTKLLQEWKQFEANLELMSKYPLYWKDPRFTTIKSLGQVSIVKGSSPTKAMSVTRPRCFFDIQLAESKQNLGRIIFELYVDFAPETCANFEALCRGFNGISYKNTPFHRILPGYWCQGGDVTNFNGTGGTSIYGDKFGDENVELRHVGPGILSTCSNQRNNNDSKFNITFKSLPTMDGQRVVFGRIVQGLSNIYKVEGFGSKSGKPRGKVIVSRCGMIPVIPKKLRARTDPSAANQNMESKENITLARIETGMNSMSTNW